VIGNSICFAVGEITLSSGNTVQSFLDLSRHLFVKWGPNAFLRFLERKRISRALNFLVINIRNFLALGANVSLLENFFCLKKFLTRDETNSKGIRGISRLIVGIKVRKALRHLRFRFLASDLIPGKRIPVAIRCNVPFMRDQHLAISPALLSGQGRGRHSFEYELRQLDSPLFPPHLFVR